MSWMTNPSPWMRATADQLSSAVRNRLAGEMACARDALARAGGDPEVALTALTIHYNDVTAAAMSPVLAGAVLRLHRVSTLLAEAERTGEPLDPAQVRDAVTGGGL